MVLPSLLSLPVRRSAVPPGSSPVLMLKVPWSSTEPVSVVCSGMLEQPLILAVPAIVSSLSMIPAAIDGVTLLPEKSQLPVMFGLLSLADVGCWRLDPQPVRRARAETGRMKAIVVWNGFTGISDLRKKISDP